MNRRWFIATWVIAGLILVIGGPLFAVLNDNSAPEPDAPTLDEASKAASRFLDRYVDTDGRVVRRDQGQDTVSEGQAYAMLVAVAINDKTRFDAAWKWTKDNLRQSNGLSAWIWKEGKIVDPQPATDADLDMARALSIAADRFNDTGYKDDAKDLAKAIADNELAYVGDGRPVIVAGPWARTAPYVTNPSYHSPRAEQELAKLTGDKRWTDVAEYERQLIDTIDGTPEDPRLPSDWASVPLDGKITPSSPPGQTTAPRYSWDAARTPIRLAESCNQADRDQAAQMWRVLNKSRQTKSAVGMTLTGDILEKDQRALGSVAGAAAAKAAGDTIQMSNLLDIADRADVNQRTYYGSAWAALGRIMLTTDWLGPC